MVGFPNVGYGSPQVEDGYILAVRLCMATEQGIIEQFGGVPCYYSLITKLHAFPTAEPKAHIVPSDSPNHGSQGFPFIRFAWDRLGWISEKARRAAGYRGDQLKGARKRGPENGSW
jgi:hypothetical protein